MQNQIKENIEANIKKGVYFSSLKIKIHYPNYEQSDKEHLFEMFLERILSSTRAKKDFVYSIKNNIFLLFLNNCSLKNAKKVFNRIKAELNKIDGNCKFSANFFEIKVSEILQGKKFSKFLST